MFHGSALLTALMFVGLLRTMRPHQWVKNLFVMLPLVFGQELFHTAEALRAAYATLLFCLASSAVYVGNDLVDVESDRAHPIKCRRPIASGAVTESAARWAMLALGSVAVGGGLLIAPEFALCAGAYLVLNLAYSLRLKRIPYIDVGCIALGFELRVLGGSFAVPVEPSVYLLLVTFALALFLGFGKRRHELGQGERAGKQRAVLRAYRTGAVDALLWVSAAVTIAVYAAYTLEPATRGRFGTDYLVITTLFTGVGVMRFLSLVRGSHDAESPTEQMLKDAPFIGNLAAWALVTLLLIYFAP